jgi:hypothetical protein
MAYGEVFTTCCPPFADRTWSGHYEDGNSSNSRVGFVLICFERMCCMNA